MGSEAVALWWRRGDERLADLHLGGATFSMHPLGQVRSDGPAGGDP